jgi:hypothetical protein
MISLLWNKFLDRMVSSCFCLLCSALSFLRSIFALFHPFLTSSFSFLGFYLDVNILQCDSYFGIVLYICSTIAFVYMILGYFYMIFSMIHLVVQEFKTSKRIDVLDKLIKIRDEEYRDYQVFLLSFFPLSLRAIFFFFSPFCFFS